MNKAVFARLDRNPFLQNIGHITGFFAWLHLLKVGNARLLLNDGQPCRSVCRGFLHLARDLVADRSGDGWIKRVVDCLALPNLPAFPFL